uniref:2-oxoacid oxidoreductase (ferredoxin) n=1 Tax=Fervidicoccus fontis TaxID=683846 RepID=A0A7J3ZKY3_9CREN
MIGVAPKETSRGGLLKALSANEAVAEAVKDLDVDVIAAYPITPQTTVVEKLAEYVANGLLDAEFVPVESEHSALSVVLGASAVGARSFTATSSQGLIYMHEMLHIASGLRLPIVMSVAMRALSAPISIWNDHSDVMNVRDSGWIIYFVSSAQEAYDTTLMAYRLAEDPSVLLPVMVAYDGFIASHTIEPVSVEGRDAALDFAPKRVTWETLDPKNPVTMGAITSPDYYYEIKYQQVDAMKKALERARDVEREFGNRFGRGYGLVEGYMVEDAEAALLVTASYWDNVRIAVDLARKKGLKAGALKLRLYRPFPREELLDSIKNLKVLGVIDRAISYGATPSGPLAVEIIAAIRERSNVAVQSIVAGIGQRTVYIEDYLKLFERLKEIGDRGERPDTTLFYGVRA